MLPRAVPYAIVGVLSLLVVAGAGWARVAGDPFGGEPFAVVSADPSAAGGGKKPGETLARGPSAQPANERPNRYDGPPPEGTPQAEAPGRTITIIDGTSGKRQDVVIPASPDG